MAEEEAKNLPQSVIRTYREDSKGQPVVQIFFRLQI